MWFIPSLLSAAGSALGISGMLGSANQFEGVAGLRYTIDRANAESTRQREAASLRLQAAGNRTELSAARTNLQLAISDANARRRNAERLRLFAEARTKQGREALRRRSREFDEFRGSEAAAVGASGVQFSGSALEVMAENEMQMRLELQDMNDATAFERDELLDRATFEQAGANLDQSRAQAQFGFARRGAALNQAGIRLAQLSSQSAFRSALQQAEFTRMEGLNAAMSQRGSAIGSALSGVGNFMLNRFNAQQLTPANWSASARPVGSSIFKT
jgi:hypothetical protein